MWNFITSPINLEKITSKKKIVALCRCHGPGLPGTVRGLVPPHPAGEGSSALPSLSGGWALGIYWILASLLQPGSKDSLSSRDHSWNLSFPCELPDGERMCKSFHTGCVYYKHMFSWRLDTPCYHPRDPHSVHLWLLKHYSSQQPCWLRCRAGLLPLARALLALPFGFSRALNQPCIMSMLNSHLLKPVCMCTAETSGGAKVPCIIFLHCLQA